ncbi:hypothetical protein ABG067_005877 [Albugo candida]
MSSIQDKRALVLHLTSQVEQLEVAAQCFDLDATLKVLNELALLLLHQHECDKSPKILFLDHCYHEFTSKLIALISVYWGSSLTLENKQKYVDVFFTEVPCLHAFESLNALLAKKPDFTSNNDRQVDIELDQKAVADECIRLLHLILISDDKIYALIQNLFEMEACRALGCKNINSNIHQEPRISSIITLPDLVHNRQGRMSAYLFKPAIYFSKLCRSMLQVALKARRKNATYKMDTFRSFCNKMKRTGRIDYLCNSWLQLLSEAETTQNNISDDPLFTEHIELIKILPEACYEDVLSHLCTSKCQSFGDLSSKVLSSLSSLWTMLSLFVSQTSENEHFRHTLIRKISFEKRINSVGTIKVIVDALNGHFYHSHFPGKSSQALTIIFGELVYSWSQREFSYGKDQLIIASVTTFIRYAMPYVLVDGKLSEKWILILCKGIQVNLICILEISRRTNDLIGSMSQTYLDSSVKALQETGMQVGQSLSHFASPDKHLDFGLAGDDIVDRMNDTDLKHIQPIPLSSDPSDETKRNNHLAAKSLCIAKKGSHLAPDEIVAESDDESENVENISNCDSNGDSDLSLSPYDLDDDQKDLGPSRPYYLKDLVVALQNQDEKDIEVALLTEAESLIRKRPMDLDMQAKTMAQVILRLEDRCSIPEFDIMKTKALAALCTHSPAKVIPFCINQVLEKEQMLESRITILKCMAVAAYELSQTGDFRHRQPKDLLMEDIETDTLQLIRTRRWGFQRNPLAPSKKNAFGDHSRTFFYPLIYGYIHYRHSAKTLSDLEHILLSHVLYTLSCIVECSGNSVYTPSMARILLDFAWVERKHSQAGVRRQVLYCISRVFLVLPSYLVQQQLGEKLSDIMQWLSQVRKEDPDTGCREAASLLKPVSELVLLSK